MTIMGLVETIIAPHLPNRQVGSGSLPTSAPTGNDVNLKVMRHGVVPISGRCSIEVSGTCIITLWVFSPASKTWIKFGASSSDYQKSFSGAGADYFGMDPGASIFFQSDTGSITGYTDAPTA